MTSPTSNQHRERAPSCVACAVVTVSDTRSLETDRGGQLLSDLLRENGHRVERRELIADEREQVEALLASCEADARIEAVLITGGTGISSRDQTFEAVSQMLTKPLPGYGELFRMLSYQEIGPAAMLSRATAGLLQQMLVVTMPGSPAAVRLAMEKLLLPELGHLVYEARK